MCQGQRRHILTAVHEALQPTSPAAVLVQIHVHYIAQWLSAQCTQHAEFPAHSSQTCTRDNSFLLGNQCPFLVSLLKGEGLRNHRSFGNA